MMASASVSVELVGVETGLWCRDCLLSTGARLWYTTSTGASTSLRDKLFCTEGQEHTVDATSD